MSNIAQPSPTARRSLAGTTACLLLLVFSPASAQDSSVVVVPPRASDAGASQPASTREVVTTLADKLAGQVNKIDTLGADFSTCLTKAGQLPGVEASARQNATTACRVAHSADTRSLYESLQPVLYDAETAFSAQADQIAREEADLSAQISAATQQKGEAQSALDTLLAQYKGKAAALAAAGDTNLTRPQQAEINQFLRLTTLSDIAAKRAGARLANLERKRDFAAKTETALRDFAAGWHESAANLDIGIASETARLEGLTDDADWAATVDTTNGLPGLLAGLGDQAYKIGTFLNHTDTTDQAGPNAGAGLPAPDMPKFQTVPSGVQALQDLYRQHGIALGKGGM
jgi:hypothetical protein